MNLMENDYFFDTFFWEKRIAGKLQGADILHSHGNFALLSFNGKEKDYESGFHYYGARYYWCEVLTGWLSVDPMADKYPNISPYAYCSWNPVLLVDPDGEFPILPFIFAMKGAARGVEHFSQNSNVKTFAYTVNHPYNAMRIGIMKDGGEERYILFLP